MSKKKKKLLEENKKILDAIQVNRNSPANITSLLNAIELLEQSIKNAKDFHHEQK